VADQEESDEKTLMPKKDDRCTTFGQVVRKYRHRKGISQEALADLTGIHRTYIGGIERGERNPTLLMIHRIAEALGVNPACLFQPSDPGQGTE
jgi:transcriptional regulator with XRE-family HTH domain